MAGRLVYMSAPMDIPLNLDGGRIEEYVELLRGVGYPVVIWAVEAGDRGELAQTVCEVNRELEALGCKPFALDGFARGQRGTLHDVVNAVKGAS